MPKSVKRRRGVTSPYTEDAIDHRRRQEMAYQLLIAGVGSFEKIAATPDKARGGQRLYSDRSACKRAIEAAIARHTGFNDSEIQKHVAVAQCDAAMLALAPAVNRGDPLAHREQRGWQDQKNRILGTYAPVRARVDVVTEDAIDARIRVLSEQHDELAREAAAAP